MELPCARMPLKFRREWHSNDNLLLLPVQRDGPHLQKPDEGRAIQHRLHALEHNPAHGMSTALPKTSRSISSLNGPLISASETVLCTTGVMRPSATRRSSSIWSSRVHPFE